jgi:hypothetical protein
LVLTISLLSIQMCFAFKPVLEIAVNRFFELGSDAAPDAPMAIVASLYNALNAVDFPGVTGTQHSDVEMRLLRRTLSANPLSGNACTSNEYNYNYLGMIMYISHVGLRGSAMTSYTQVVWEGTTTHVKMKLCSYSDHVRSITDNHSIVVESIAFFEFLFDHSCVDKSYGETARRRLVD